MMRRLFLAMIGLASLANSATADEKKPAASATHDVAATIAVKSSIPGINLQTLCVDSENHVVALLAGDRYGGSKGLKSEVQVYDADGKMLRSWTVPFIGQSINAGPGGIVFVAGEGRLAKFDKAGEELANVELPHVGKLLSDKSALLERAKESLAESIASMEEQVKSIKEMADKAKANEEKAGEAKANSPQANAKQLASMLKSFEAQLTAQKKREPESMIAEITNRLRISNGLAVTDKDIFVVSGSLKGYGYNIWRMDHNFSNPKMVLADIGGCCGQMDIQAVGEDLFVAENTRHRVGHYNRDGKRIGSFGKSSRDGSDPSCFGGCCNPMNVRIAGPGIYTAESEGIVKLFSPAGEFLSLVGSLKIKEGCKNVAIAASSDGSKVYFCDQPGKTIHVLAKKPGKVAAE